jgi:hypothetical protein
MKYQIELAATAKADIRNQEKCSHLRQIANRR